MPKLEVLSLRDNALKTLKPSISELKGKMAQMQTLHHSESQAPAGPVRQVSRGPKQFGLGDSIDTRNVQSSMIWRKCCGDALVFWSKASAVTAAWGIKVHKHVVRTICQLVEVVLPKR